MRQSKELIKKVNNFIQTNGGLQIDFKKDNIHFFNGAYFQDMNDDFAELWVKDLDELINYLRRLRSFLNKNGIQTGLKRGNKK